MVKSSYQLAKDFAQDIIPPFFWRILVNLKLRTQNVLAARSLKPEWEFIPQGWDYSKTHLVRGWDAPDILQVYKNKWNKFVELANSTAPLGIAHEADLTNNESIEFQNTILVFAYCLALAAHKKDFLSMLDWGGGIGHYYIFARALLPEIVINYHCKDLPTLVAHGTKLFPNQYFYTDESCLEQKFDFVMASGSMHYDQDWAKLLCKLAQASKGYLFITRLPIVLSVPSFIFIQRPYRYGYNTEYLGWCINREEFLTKAEKLSLKLIREFIIDEHPSIVSAPEDCQYRGFLFFVA